MARFWVAMAVVACLTAWALPAAAKKSNPAAVALFEKAIAASDLEAKGSPAFRLQATVRVFGANNQHTDGMLVEFWTPDGKWREETILQGYQLVVVSNGQNEWIKNTLNYVPFDVYELWEALAFPGRLQRWLDPSLGEQEVAGVTGADMPRHHDARIGKPKRKGREGVECVSIGPSNIFAYKGEFCLDPSTGHAVEEVANTGLRYEYSDYMAFGEKSFPTTLAVFEGQKTELLEIHIDGIDPLTTIPPGTFLPTQGSEKEPTEATCKLTIPVRAVKTIDPAYPPAAVEKRLAGKVLFYGYVGRDGVARGLTPMDSPSPVLTGPALQSLKLWRFRPAVCEGGALPHPVAQRIYVAIRFRLMG